MKKCDIKVGGEYIAKVNGQLTRVRVDRIHDDWRPDGSSLPTRYYVTNLRTGRQTTFRSAVKFRREATPAPRTTDALAAAGHARAAAHQAREETACLKEIAREAVCSLPPEPLAEFRRGVPDKPGYVHVWLTFVPMREFDPYEVEETRGLAGSKTTFRDRDEAVHQFQGLVGNLLSGI